MNNRRFRFGPARRGIFHQGAIDSIGPPRDQVVDLQLQFSYLERGHPKKNVITGTVANALEVTILCPNKVDPEDERT